MLRLLSKIVRTPRCLVDPAPYAVSSAEVTAVGEKIHDEVIRLFRGSLAIRQIDAGSDNACEQELVALGNNYYDIDRFGIHFVASPRHADMLLVTGPVSRNMAEAVRRTCDATPDPRIIVAVGDDAVDGGLFRGSYAVMDGVASVVPVHYRIPGDPPSPLTILRHLLVILRALDTETMKTA